MYSRTPEGAASAPLRITAGPALASFARVAAISRPVKPGPAIFKRVNFRVMQEMGGADQRRIAHAACLESRASGIRALTGPVRMQKQARQCVAPSTPCVTLLRRPYFRCYLCQASGRARTVGRHSLLAISLLELASLRRHIPYRTCIHVCSSHSSVQHARFNALEGEVRLPAPAHCVWGGAV